MKWLRYSNPRTYYFATMLGSVLEIRTTQTPGEQTHTTLAEAKKKCDAIR